MHIGIRQLPEVIDKLVLVQNALVREGMPATDEEIAGDVDNVQISYRMRNGAKQLLCTVSFDIEHDEPNGDHAFLTLELTQFVQNVGERRLVDLAYSPSKHHWSVSFGNAELTPHAHILRSAITEGVHSESSALGILAIMTRYVLRESP